MTQVYTDYQGFKTINVPYSLMYWARKRHKRTVCLLRPSPKQILANLAHSLKSSEIQDLGYTSVFVEILNKMVWFRDHEREGCKLCNKHADLQVMPKLLDSLKSTRIGQKKLNVEENYMTNRIISMLRLSGNTGKSHDVLIPRSLVGGLIRSIYAADISSIGEETTYSEYLSTLAKDLNPSDSCEEISDLDLGILSAILTKDDSSNQE